MSALKHASRMAVAASCIAPCACVMHAHAQDFPSRTIRVIVPFPAGGATDIMARALSPHLSRVFGQNVVVDNRAGGNTVIGTEAAFRAPADGHTLLIVAPSIAINPLVRSKMPYDTLRDFAGLAHIASSPITLATHPSVPVRDIKQLIALARAKPGELTFATSSIMGGQRLAAERFFRERAKLDIIAVAYNGGAPAATAVVGGHTMILVSSLAEASQHIGIGRLRGMAVMSLARNARLPDLPTVAESGYPNFEATNWYGAIMRSATPRAVIERISSEIARGLQTTEAQTALARFGVDVDYQNAAAFDAYIRTELQRNERVVKLLNLKIE